MKSLSSYLLWIALTILHTWLFFQESMGLNALLFSVLMVAAITWQHNLAKDMVWLFAAGGHLMAAMGVYWHGPSIAIPVYHLSGFLLAGFVFARQSRFPIAFINGLIASFGGGFLFLLFKRTQSTLHSGMERSGLSRLVVRGVTLYVAPIAVTIVFYLLYSSANPDFLLNLNIPNWELNFDTLFYTMVGLVVLCPLFFSWGIKPITEIDRKIGDDIVRTRSSDNIFENLGFLTENKQGVILFGMLNCLILVFLGFNILQIFFPSLHQAGSNHSEQVHQGFETLVLSVGGAIVLIMYYFRGNQNFFSGRQRLVNLALLWVLLNGALVLFTTYKNVMYVDAFGFTYKRIFVFVAMILTGMGLYLTYRKIKHLKSNWHLISQTSWVIFFMLTVSSLVDWDRLIAWYNINYASALDVVYFKELGDNKLPYILDLRKQNDPRLVPYKAEVDEMLNKQIPDAKSWKSATLDRTWLRRELSE